MRRSPAERGSALVEFAVAATVFFVTILATMEYGRMVFAYNMVSFAAREGARYAAVRGSMATGHVASESDIQSYSAAKSAGWVSAADVTVRCGTVAVDITTTCASNNQPGRYVQSDERLDLIAQREDLGLGRLAEVAVIACLTLLERPRQHARDVGRDDICPDEVLLEQRDDAAVP